jgi:hypothetical protein
MAGEAQVETFAPAPQQQRANQLQRQPRRDREAEHDGDMKTHLELATDIDFAQRPSDERNRGQDGDDLPRAALSERGCTQPVLTKRRVQVRTPEIPVAVLTDGHEQEERSQYCRTD